MSANDHHPIPRSFSNIDDGLNLLLAELKAEDGPPGVKEAPISLSGFTPFRKSESLGPDALIAGRLATPAAVSAAAAPAGPLLTSSSYTVLTGAGSAVTPLVLPNTFIPVPSAPHKAPAGSGAKLRPGGEPPPLHLQHSGGSGAFSIAAYGRPFTQLDFISTDDLDEGGATGGGSGGSVLAEFGELADESRLGDLPTEDELRLMLISPGGVPGAAASGQYGHSHSHAQGQGHGQGQGPGGASEHPRVVVHIPPKHPSLPNAYSFSSSHDHGHAHGLGPSPFEASTQAALAAAAGVRPPTILCIRTGAGAPGGAARAAHSADSGSPKRRADRMELDSRAYDSPRGGKRHSSGTWSEGSDEAGGESPCSADHASSALNQGWFIGEGGQQRTGSGSSSLQPSRFGLEHSRRHAAVHESGDELAYGIASGRHAPWQRQQYQQYHHQQYQRYHVVEVAEEAPAQQQQQQPQQQQQQQFRGVSRHRLTQRWEASLWLNGRQLYLGGFNSQEDAAHAYDLAALACKGLDAQINFSPEDYTQQLKEIAGYTRDEVVAYVRRRSSAFSRGKSRYRGVSGHNGRWEARIGSFNGRKNVSFGVFDTEEGAARQYDRALILEKGRIAKTNFPIRDYDAEVAEYEDYLLRKCGATSGPATYHEAMSVTLPRNREATADEKKRSAVIYADALLRALCPPQQAQRGGRS